MALVPVFTGHVTLGKLILDDRRGLLDLTRTFEGQAVELTIKKRRTQRSIDQNAYWHAVPFTLMSEYWGCSMEETKLLLMGECWGWHEVNGHRIPIKPSTSSMTTEEGSHFTEWMPPWCMTEFRVQIPLPGEVEVPA